MPDCKCGAKSCFFCKCMCLKDELNGDTPLIIQRNAQFEDVCSICDKTDLSYFPDGDLVFRDKDHNSYMVNPITLEITYQGQIMNVKDLPVIAYHDYLYDKWHTETFFIGNGDILHAFGIPYPRNMCGYLTMSIWSKNVFLLSSGLLDNLNDGCLVGPLKYPQKLYYLNIFE